MDEVAPGYAHDALFYQSDEEMVASAVPFLRAALDRPEVAMLACAERNAALLAGALDGDPRIPILDRSELYRRVPVAIEALQRTARNHVAAGADRVRLVEEIDYDRYDWGEWVRFDALSNVVFEPYPMSAMCLYDTRRVRPEVLEAARRTHPYLVTGAERAPNPGYVSPARFLRQFATPDPDPLEVTPPAIEVTGVIDLYRLRQEVKALLTGATLGPLGTSGPAATARPAGPTVPAGPVGPAGMTGPAEAAGAATRPDAVNAFVFAVSEVTTNALTYGRPPVRVRVWHARDRSVCTVTDHGDGFDDPLGGYVPPADGQVGKAGRGVWMARQMCDVVSFVKTPDAFTVRIINRGQ